MYIILMKDFVIISLLFILAYMAYAGMNAKPAEAGLPKIAPEQKMTEKEREQCVELEKKYIPSISGLNAEEQAELGKFLKASVLESYSIGLEEMQAKYCAFLAKLHYIELERKFSKRFQSLD